MSTGSTGGETKLSRYEPERSPHDWLPEGVELKTWEQIEPWYHKLLAAAGPLGFRARAMADRGR